MKLAVAVLAALSGTGAFSPPASRRSPSAASSSSFGGTTGTALRQYGTLGFDTAGLYSREEEDALRTRDEVIAYLAPLLSPTAVRSDLGDAVLVSGFDPRDPGASEVLSFLNAEDSPHFPFRKIVAHVEDVKAAKKRLIGREARYTGLLDKLAFSEGSGVPSAEQLEGVTSWVARVGGGDLGAVDAVAAAAEQAESVTNVAILVSGAGSAGGEALRDAAARLERTASTFRYTLLVVPEWNDEPEASRAYGLVNVTDVAEGDVLLPNFFEEGASFSRQESLRLITECLAIDGAAGSRVAAYAGPDPNGLEDMLIQGMREAGYARLGEVEHMVVRGVKGYNDMVAEKSKTTAWEKAPEPSDEEKARIAKTEEERGLLRLQQRKEANKKAELEDMATQWAKREYLRKSLKRRIPIKEKEFVEIVWERAMFEADLKYRTMQGQAVNEGQERKDFRARQEKKKEDAYRAEKERWSGMEYDELEPPEEKTVSFR